MNGGSGGIMQQTNTLTGAEAVVRMLEAYDVRHIFASLR